MKPKGRITAFNQHIIDVFRTWRSEENISGRKFSLVITEDNPTRVGNIESIFNNDIYSPKLIKKGLDFFEKTVKDLYPSELLDEDTLRDKTKIIILKEMSIRASLNSLWENGYFDEGRFRSEITEKYNSFFSPDAYKMDSDFSAQLEDMYNQKWLLKIYPKMDKQEKLIKFIKNSK